MLIVIVVVFGGMMWWQSKKAKQQQQEKQDFRSYLQPGTEVITIGGIIGKVVESTSSMRRSSSTPKAPYCVSPSAPSPGVHPSRLSSMTSDENGTRCPTKTPRLRLTMRLVRFRSTRRVRGRTADETGDDNETKTK